MIPDAIDRAIDRSIADRRATFVFPSGTVAKERAVRAAARHGAVRTDRFLAWDEFRDRGTDGSLLASDAARTLWTAGLLADNAEKPFLRALVPPDRARAWKPFLPFVASLLPALSPDTRFDASGAGPETALALQDLAELRARYAGFLSSRGLAEDSWPRAIAIRPDERVSIFGSELIEDFERWRPGLPTDGSVVLEPSFSGGFAEPLVGFESGWDELKAALLVARDAVASGLPADRVRITVAGLDAARPWLERLAFAMDVPISIMAGRSLASSPPGRLFARIAACAERDFDFVSTRDLLLDRWPSWSDPGANRELVDLGTGFHAWTSWREGALRVDSWEGAFRSCRDRGKADRLRTVYRDLRARIGKMASAEGFGALRSAFQAFRERFLDAAGGDGESEAWLERCMNLASEYAELESVLGLSTPGALGIFLSALAATPYVPASRAGIPVYPYRVSALSAPALHVVAGCSQEGLRVRRERGAALREETRARLGWQGEDASMDYAKAYAASGERVIFTWSREGFEGFSPPWHGFTGEPLSPAATKAFAGLRDPLAEELALWSTPPGERAVFSGIPAARAEAARTASEVVARKPVAGLDAETARRAFARLRSKASARHGDESGTEEDGPEASDRPEPTREKASDGRVARWFGVYDLESYRACPRRWLLAQGLGLKERAIGPSFFDPRFEGTLIHRAAELAWNAIGGIDERPAVERFGDYEAAIDAAVDEAVRALDRDHGPFIRATAETWKPSLRRIARALVRDELEWSAGGGAGETEVSLSLALGDAVFSGRIDRVSRLPDGGVAIVDYKRSESAKVDESLADADGELSRPQLAGYVTLLEGRGERVSLASLYACSSRKRSAVLGGERTREAFEPTMRAFRALFDSVARGVDALEFGPARGRKPCFSCDARPVCRRAYATESRR